MDEPRQESTQEEYEAPRADDVSTEDAPSVTAAGKSGSQVPGAGA
jgi:hypothetical protein